jgi:hypothetical protein
MSEIARDYAAAVALISASPSAHFTVGADGGIRKESAIKSFFGHRPVTEQKMDEAVGEALLQMYDRAVAQSAGSGRGLDLVAPRQLDVVARFIVAYDRMHAAQQQARHNPSTASLTDRSVKVQVHEPTDAGSKHLQTFQQVLSANGMAPGDMVDHVQRLQKAAASYSPATLHVFNNFALGGGNLTFQILYNHPECMDPTISADERHTRYQNCARPYVAAAKAKMAEGEHDYVQAQLAEGFPPEEAQSLWELRLESTNSMFDTNGNLHHQFSSGLDCLVPLGRYIADAHQQSLTVEQAMTPIRLWMGGNPDTLESIWQTQPDKAPPLAEIALIARMVEKGIPLSDAQADTALKYFQPKSS